jgi:sugar (pentulose or hexulose) kinase
MSKEVFIGIDIATSNVRAVAIDRTGTPLARASEPLAQVIKGADKSATQDSKSWITAVDNVLTHLCKQLIEEGFIPQSLLISATSGTFVLCDKNYAPIAPAAMYNDGRASDPLARAAVVIKDLKQSGPFVFANTPEFVIAHLSDQPLAQIPTDTSHALKMGVDFKNCDYLETTKEIAKSLNITLPKLVLPGTKIATISNQIAAKLGIPTIPIYAGMTDGCTAQIAAGGATGSVTSLGTTMVIKVVADSNISGDGFYSHFLPSNRYLLGVASNIGGVSYQKFANDIESFNDKAAQIPCANFITYPLTVTGERFPIKSSSITNLISTKPESDVMEYRGILEGLAFTEKYAYDLLQKAGAKLSQTIYTTGGGGKSKVLSQIRANILNREVAITNTTGSDMGAAFLSLASHTKTGDDLTGELMKINISHGEIFKPMQDEALNSNYQKYLSLITPYI